MLAPLKLRPYGVYKSVYDDFVYNDYHYYHDDDYYYRQLSYFDPG